MGLTLAGVSAAEEYLSFAFEHCHRLSQKNKRMILIYLLPVKMLLVSNCYLALMGPVALKKFIDFLKHNRWHIVEYNLSCM